MTPKSTGPSNRELAGLGVQMVIFIGIFVYAGYKLDEWAQTERKWFTLVFSFVGSILSMVYVITRFTRKS